MGRVIVLAYDGLETTLVEKFNLTTIMQAEHGRVSLEGFPEPLATPILWRSFLLGDLPQNWKRTHLFNVANSWGIAIPGYNEWIDFVPLRAGLSKAILEKLDPAPYLEGCYKMYRKKKEISYNLLKKGGWDLFMTHIFAADIIGHWICYDESQMRELYSDLEAWTATVMELVQPDDLVLIVSDHGLFWNPKLHGGWGEHSKYGFYSLNIPLELENPHLTDFYTLITKRFIAEKKEGT